MLQFAQIEGGVFEFVLGIVFDFLILFQTSSSLSLVVVINVIQRLSQRVWDFIKFRIKEKAQFLAAPSNVKECLERNVFRVAGVRLLGWGGLFCPSRSIGLLVE